MNDIRLFNDDLSASFFRRCFGPSGFEREITDILAWAVRRDIPFHEALSALYDIRSTGRRRTGIKTGSFLDRDIAFRERGSLKTRLKHAIGDLQDGKALGPTLRKWLSKYLSHYFLAAVENAERNRCLHRILPQLAKSANFRSGLKEHISNCVMYPTIQFSTSMIMILGLYMFMIPKLEIIYEEISRGVPLPGLLAFVNTIAAYCSQAIFPAIVALLWMVVAAPAIIYNKIDPNSDIYLLLAIVMQLIFFILVPFIYFKATVKFLRFILRPVTNMASNALIHVPYLGRQLRKLALLEVAGAMATLTGAGYDIADAARWNADAVSRRWLRRRLAKFANAVESGRYWADAWCEEMKLGSKAHDWIIGNAACRQNPEEGFLTLSEWLADEIRSANTLLLSFFEVFCILFNAALIGFTVFAIWQGLWTLIYYSTQLD